METALRNSVLQQPRQLATSAEVRAPQHAPVRPHTAFKQGFASTIKGHKCSPRLQASRSVRLAASAAKESSAVDVDWDTLGFGLQHTAPMMYEATWTADGGWEGGVKPFANLQLSPAAQVLNYGQSIFEGMKARRTSDGKIVLFRPDMNAQRFQDGADRLCMPRVPLDMFVDAVKSVSEANKDYVPPGDKGSLYMRPLLMGTGAVLGLAPATSYTFCIYAASVGAYFKGGQLTPINLLVETKTHRAGPGGVGGTKAAGNYSPVLQTQLAAKAEGYSDVAFLDAVHNKYLEEVSSCNIFVVKGKKIATPALKGTILPGVTRRSVIELAQDAGFEVEERDVSISDAMDADEVFTTGTAVGICAVGSLTYEGNRKQYGTDGEPTPVALQLYTTLTELQDGKSDDPRSWVSHVC